MAGKSPWRYQQVAQALLDAAERGLYRPGDRLPSVRRLCEQHGVSLATAVQAYDWLQRQGRVEARPKRGHFLCAGATVPREPATSRPPAAPVPVNVAQMAMALVDEARRPGLVKLGAAVPGADMQPLGPLSRALAGVAGRHYRAPAAYEEAGGNPRLRHEIARHMGELGWRGGADEVLITNGCLEALGLALAVVTQPGDTVAIESPTYFGILQSIEARGLRAVEIPTHPRDGIDPDALAECLARHRPAACILQPSFHNPLGATLPEARRRQVSALLAEAGVPLIEDDVYGPLSFSRHRPRPLAASDETGNVIYCSSFSKSVAPGLRLGWMLPGRWREAVRYRKFLANISTAVHPQLALAELMARGSLARNHRRVTPVYQQRMAQLRDWVGRYFPAGTRATNPEGGFLLWLELPRGIDSLELYRRAMQAGIAITPGVLFSARGQYDHHVRLSCGVVEGEPARQAIQRLGALAADLEAKKNRHPE